LKLDSGFMEPRIKSAFSCFSSASIFQSRATPPPRSHLGDLPPPAAPAHRSSKDEVAAPVVGTNSSRLAVYLASTSLEPKQRARRRRRRRPRPLLLGPPRGHGVPHRAGTRIAAAFLPCQAQHRQGNSSSGRGVSEPGVD
jgi:hypothetical protein